MGLRDASASKSIYCCTYRNRFELTYISNLYALIDYGDSNFWLRLRNLLLQDTTPLNCMLHGPGSLLGGYPSRLVCENPEVRIRKGFGSCLRVTLPDEDTNSIQSINNKSLNLNKYHFLQNYILFFNPNYFKTFVNDILIFSIHFNICCQKLRFL